MSAHPTTRTRVTSAFAALATIAALLLIPAGAAHATAPSAPTNLSATAGTRSATINFDSSDGGFTTWTPSAAWFYEITPYVDGVAQAARVWTTYAATGPTQSLSIPHLTAGQTYTFKVRGVAGDYYGPYSYSPYSAATSAVTVGGTSWNVTGLTATTPDYPARVDVSWTAPSYTAGYPIDHYTVTASGGTSKTVSTGTSTTFDGLPPGSPQTFTVTATNTNGEDSLPVTSSSATPQTAPGTPTNVTAVAGASARSVDVTWDAAGGGYDGTWTQYAPWLTKITPYVGGVAQTALAWQTWTPTGSTPTMTVPHLVAGQTYTFKVETLNGDYYGPYHSSGQSMASASVTAPGTSWNVTGLTATAATDYAARVAVSWTAPSYTAGYPIDHYTVTASGGTSKTVSTGTSTTFDGLPPGSPQTFTVTATNTNGEDSLPVTSSSATPQANPGTPTNVTAAAGPTDASADVTWDAAGGGYSGTWGIYAPWLTKITAYVGGVESRTLQTYTPTGTTPSLRMSNLVAGQTYTFKVEAINGDYYGPYHSSGKSSASASFTAPGTPWQATGVTATPATDYAARVNVSWTAPSTSGGYSLDHYTVVASSGASKTVAAGTTSVVFDGLVPGSAVSFVVTGTNTHGIDSLPSASSSVTPQASPGTPSNVTAVAGDGKATVTWDAAGGGYSGTWSIYAPWLTRITPYVGGVAQTSKIWQTYTPSGTAPSLNVPNLTNGVTYTFKVEAINGDYYGPYNVSGISGESNAVTPAP